MRRRVITIAALALCALFAAVPSAGAAGKDTRTIAVIFDNADGTFTAFGSVTSNAQRCQEGRKVILEARLPDDRKKRLGVDRGSPNGGLRFPSFRIPADTFAFRIIAPPTRAGGTRCAKSAGNVFFGQVEAR